MPQDNSTASHADTSCGCCEHDEAKKVEEAIKAGEKAASEDFKAELEKVKDERDELLKKVTELEESAKDKVDAAEANERLARLQADWENFRRRTAKERLQEQERATEHLVVNLLPILDDMERAIDHAQQSSDTSESMQQFTDGIVAVKTKMLDVLSKDGVEVIDAKGEPFNPLYHKAVGRKEDASLFNDTVCDVYQNGYRMGDKVIREAMVTVSYGGQDRPQVSDTTDEAEEE